MGTPDDCEELLEEVPLHQRRCNNFYGKLFINEILFLYVLGLESSKKKQNKK